MIFFQFSTDAPLDSSEASDSSSSSTSPNMDFFGPEMADLQQLLVSMASGKGIEIRSRSILGNSDFFSNSDA